MVYYSSSAFPSISSITEISFYLLLFLTTIFILARKEGIVNNQVPLSFIMRIIIIWGLITALFSDNIENSIHDWYKYLLFPILIIFIFVYFCREKKQFDRFIAVSVISLSLVLIGSVIYFYVIKGHTITERMNVIDETGISINSVGVVAIVPFFLGSFLLLTVKSIYRKIIVSLCMLGALVAMVLSATRGALIGFLLPLPLFFFVLDRRKIILLLCVATVLISFSPAKRLFTLKNVNHKINALQRPAIWALYGGVVADNPVTGIGFGMENYTPKLYDKYYAKLPENERKSIERHPFFYTHNMFLDTAVRTGLVGLSLLIFLLLSAFRLLVKLFTTSDDREQKIKIIFVGTSLLSLIIQGMLTDIFLIRHAFIFYMLIAIIISFYRIEKQILPA